MATSTNQASPPEPLYTDKSKSPRSPSSPSSPIYSSKSEIGVRGSQGSKSASTKLSTLSMKSDFSSEMLDSSIYMVKNLDTGESIDLRDENSHSFSESFTRVVGRVDNEIEIKEFL